MSYKYSHNLNNSASLGVFEYRRHIVITVIDFMRDVSLIDGAAEVDLMLRDC